MKRIDSHHCRCFSISKQTFREFVTKLQNIGYKEPFFEEDHGLPGAHPTGGDGEWENHSGKKSRSYRVRVSCVFLYIILPGLLLRYYK